MRNLEFHVRNHPDLVVKLSDEIWFALSAIVFLVVAQWGLVMIAAGIIWVLGRWFFVKVEPAKAAPPPDEAPTETIPHQAGPWGNDR